MFESGWAVGGGGGGGLGWREGEKKLLFPSDCGGSFCEMTPSAL